MPILYESTYVYTRGFFIEEVTNRALPTCGGGTSRNLVYCCSSKLDSTTLKLQYGVDLVLIARNPRLHIQ